MKAKSEQLFETFLRANNVQFEKIEEIKEKGAYRPDYLVTLGNLQLVFELKELAEDDNFSVVDDPTKPYIKSHSCTVGDHVRRRIESSKKQIQYGANQGIPSILLIYNSLDPVFQMFGTEDIDFTTAMYGELTILLDKRTRQSSEMFNGKNQSLQQSKNTSFSAVGRLCDRGGKTTVTLFENVFSKVTVPYEQLPLALRFGASRFRPSLCRSRSLSRFGPDDRNSVSRERAGNAHAVTLANNQAAGLDFSARIPVASIGLSHPPAHTPRPNMSRRAVTKFPIASGVAQVLSSI